MLTFELLSKSEEDTTRLAQSIAPIVELGDVLILDGDLGTGKTFFVKAFAKALGSADHITSPTFTIAQFYNIEKGQLLHIDAYRISNITEFLELGLTDYFPEAISVVEWGSKVNSEIDDYFKIEFKHHEEDENFRKITISYTGEELKDKFEELVAKLKN